ncbi:hypothetical protein ABPG75_011109 [Micractinium tetrahymenae]
MSADYADAIQSALDEAEAPGEFACGGRVSKALPELEVQGLGPLTLPLGPEAAAALAAIAQPAPYGRGSATLVDPAVRRCAQLEPAQLSVRNEEAWGAELARVVAAAAEGLGLPPQAVRAELYKCLLYGPGDFFLPHKDTEKSAGMGGRLLVRHGGEQQAFFAGNGAKSAQPSGAQQRQPEPCRWAAFFADCEHEVEEVTKGRRFCLIYNLLHVGDGPPPAAPDTAELDATLGTLRSALASWQADEAGPSKLCYVLEHEYTEAGIAGGLRALKGPDRAAAQRLAAEGLLDVHLAILEKHEMGSAEEECDWGYGKRRRCYYDDCGESEEEEEEGCGGHTMEELLEQSHSVAHWTTLAGKAMDFGEMHVDEEEEVLPPGYFENQDPDEESYEGYTGNAGATLDRWYRRAALVLWPRSRRFSVLAGANISGAICQLCANLAAGEPPGECAAFAAAVLDQLHKQPAGSYYDSAWYGSFRACSHNYSANAGADSLALLTRSIAELAAAQTAAAGTVGTAAEAALSAGTGAAALQAAGAATQPAAHSAAALSSRCLSDVLPGRLAAAQHAAPLVRLCERLGWEAMRPALLALLQASMGRPEKRVEAVALLLILCKHAAKAAAAPGAAAAAAEVACVAGLCQLVATATCALFEQQQQQQAGAGPAQRQAPLQPATMAQLLAALATLGGEAQLVLAQQLLPHAMAAVDASTVQALLLLQKRFGWAAVRPAAERLVADCQADGRRLPHSMALLRKLAEAAAGSSTSHNSSSGSAREQQAGATEAVTAAGKENAGAGQPAQQEQAAAARYKQPEQQQQAQQQQQQAQQQHHQAELQAELAGLLAAALDVALLEPDIPQPGTQQAQHAWQAQQAHQAHQARSADFVGRCPALLALTQSTAQRLRALAKPLLAPQKDWRLEGITLGCTCGDCASVKRFLEHPTTATVGMPLAEKRRKHVHQILDGQARGLVT